MTLASPASTLTSSSSFFSSSSSSSSNQSGGDSSDGYFSDVFDGLDEVTFTHRLLQVHKHSDTIYTHTYILTFNHSLYAINILCLSFLSIKTPTTLNQCQSPSWAFFLTLYVNWLSLLTRQHFQLM